MSAKRKCGFFVDEETVELVIDLVDPSPSGARGAAGGQRSGSSLVDEAILVGETITGLATRVDSVSEEFRPSLPVYRGVALAGKQGGCTVGFTGAYTDGLKTWPGFFTAAHCGTVNKYCFNTSDTGTTRASTWKKQTWNGNADIAFHAAATPTDAVYASFTLAKGQTACHRGVASGKDAKCGVVDSITYQIPSGNCNGATCNTVFVKYVAPEKGGDSGGPTWTNTTRPVGVHWGGDKKTYSSYSKLQYIPTGTKVAP